MTIWDGMFRHLIPFFLLISLILVFNACRPPHDPPEKKNEFIANFDLDKIRERGYIIVSMDNNSTGYFLYRGRTMGYEYELLKRYADEQELELHIDVTKSLEEAFDKLNRGDTDILAYNLTVTKERSSDLRHQYLRVFLCFVDANSTQPVQSARAPVDQPSVSRHYCAP